MVTAHKGRVWRTGGALVIPLVVILIVAGAGFVSYRSGKLNRFICDGPCPARYVDPPKELGLIVGPPTVTPSLVQESFPQAAKVAATVAGPLQQASLGGNVGFVALDLKTATTLASKGSGTLAPASTAKLLTAFAALSVIDPQTRFATKVVSNAPGSIVLIGAGDPFLDAKRPKTPQYAHVANLNDLAIRTAAALKKTGATSVSLGFDDSLFSGPATTPHWPSTYLSENVVTPISALWADQGVGSNGIRSRTPARSAADVFAGLLRSHGITVKPEVNRVTAPHGSHRLAQVQSATVAQILESTIQHSDNQAAEVMLRHIAIATGRAGTFEAGTASLKGILAKEGISTAGLELYDGSGLSRDDRVSPRTLAQTVRKAADDPEASSLISDLPVGGFNGSLRERFGGRSARAGLGVVHAKTGTLTGVSSLAGIVRDLDGRPIVFAIMADQTKVVGTLAAEDALDNVVAAIAGCHCGR